MPALEDAIVKAVAGGAMVLRIGLDGTPLGSLHDHDAAVVSSVSTALPAHGRLYLGSHSAHHVATVPLSAVA